MSSTSNYVAKLEALHKQIEKLCHAASTAGLSIGVAKGNQIIFQDHFGTRDVDVIQPPDLDTVYHLGSLTKAMTAAGLAVLVEEGKMAWDQRLRELVPGFHQKNAEVEAEATVIDLLSHRMGLAMRMNYWAQMEQELLLPPEQAVNVLGSLDKRADFRTTLNYNNWTYSIAGEIIERLSGMALEDFMQEHFFRPLNLNHTTYAKPMTDNYASCHIALSDGHPYKVPHPRISSGTLLGGAAGLKSSTGDLLRLYSAFLEAFKDQALTGKTSTPNNPFKQTAIALHPHGQKNSTSYGLGWFLVDLPAELGWIGINDGRVAKNPIIGQGLPSTQVAYHNGSMPGILASVHLVPSEDLAIVILGNTLAFADLPDYVGGMIIDTLLGSTASPDFMALTLEAKASVADGYARTLAKLKADQKTGTSHRDLQDYVGHYVNAQGNFMLDVRLHERGLRMHVQGLPETYYDLDHYHDDTFAWACDRDAEAKRAMFPQLSDAFRKICFSAGSDGSISTIHWAYARDEPAGEDFNRVEKKASSGALANF